MTKFFNKFQKPCFWSICPILEAKKIFLQNPVVTHNFIRVSKHHAKIYKKANVTIPRKRQGRLKDKQKDRRMEGQTLFYRTLSATAGSPQCCIQEKFCNNLILMIYLNLPFHISAASLSLASIKLSKQVVYHKMALPL